MFSLLLKSSKIKSKLLTRAYTALSILHLLCRKVEFLRGEAQLLGRQADLISELALSRTSCVTWEQGQSLNSQGLSVLIPKMRIIIMGHFQE